MLYKCEHCDYASNRKYNLKTHVKNKHEKFLHEAAKRTHNEMEEEDAEALKKYLIKKQMNIKKKLAKVKVKF